MRQKRRLEMESVAREIKGAAKESMEEIEQAIERAKRVLQAKEDDRNKETLE